MLRRPERIDEILTRLHRGDQETKLAAIEELSTFDHERALASLVILLEDDDAQIAERAATALSRHLSLTTARLLIPVLSSEEAGARNLALRVLAEIGPEAVAPLVEQINSDNATTRKFVCDLLGLIGDHRAVWPLCERLKDSSGLVVVAAVEALGQIGSAHAVEDLITAALKRSEAHLAAIEALGQIGDNSALKYLYSCLEARDSRELHIVMSALGSIGDSDAVSPLLRFLDHESRTTAERALLALVEIEQIQKQRLQFPFPWKRFSGFLFDNIRAHNSGVTEFTLSRLQDWHDSNAVLELLEVVDVVADKYLQRITEIITELGPSMVAPIIDKLPSASRSQRTKLLDIVKFMIDESSASLILPYLEDDEPDVRQRAAHILGISGFAAAIDDLKSLTADPVGQVRAAAYSALGWLCSEEDVDVVLVGLEDECCDVREAAAGALIVVGGPRVVAKFTADLYHEDPKRQCLAVSALGWIGDAEVIHPLEKAAAHPSPEIRKSAITALSRLGEVGIRQPLVFALSDDNSAVRRAAVSALATMNGVEAVQEISLLLEDVDLSVRLHTIQTISAIGDQRHVDLLTTYVDDQVELISVAALATISKLSTREPQFETAAIPINIINIEETKSTELALSQNETGDD